MKQLIVIICLFSLKSTLQAQALYNYLLNQGASTMASFAHPSNTLDKSSSYITSYENYFIIDLSYTDKNYNGENIHTRVEIDKGAGSLYFGNVRSLDDNDIVPPFFASVAAIKVALEAIKENNPQEYYKEMNNLSDYLGIQPENWNASQWVLCVLNIDYASYRMGN